MHAYCLMPARADNKMVAYAGNKLPAPVPAPAPKSDAVSKELRLAQASTKSACWVEPSLAWPGLAWIKLR